MSKNGQILAVGDINAISSAGRDVGAVYIYSGNPASQISYSRVQKILSRTEEFTESFDIDFGRNVAVNQNGTLIVGTDKSLISIYNICS
jgi:hypothetical protein